ncbi:MAG TPA: hypothetical protein VII28_12815 [Puia sp.]
MTNKQIKRHKFLTDNEYAKLGAVTNNTIVQVASIVEPFSGNTIALSGIFYEQTAKDLLDQIKKEIKQHCQF